MRERGQDDTHSRQVSETLTFLDAKLKSVPEILISLGTGITTPPASFQPLQSLEYSDIPHFPSPSVVTHPGRLTVGTLGGRTVAILQGRVHYYEGYSARTVAYPVRCLALFGCRTFLATNAAGGLRKEMAPGEIMIVRDHLNFIPDNPLRGSNVEAWGPRFPDMSQAYAERLRVIGSERAAALKIRLHHGVYAAVPGPSLETAAETRFLQLCGADAVGMSTVPEVIVAAHAGMETLVLSLLANINDPDHFTPILLDEVLQQVALSEKKVLLLLEAIIADL